MNDIITFLEQQETFILKTRDRLEKLQKPYKDSPDFIKMVNEFTGMLKLAEHLGIDTKPFEWIYKLNF